MTKLLLVIFILLTVAKEGSKFGEIIKDDGGYEYLALRGCNMNLVDGTTTGGFNGRCYVPLDGGTESDNWMAQIASR